MSSAPSVPPGPSTTSRHRFVTACQQALALGVVVAVLTPAARTVTMDVRPPADSGANPVEGALLRSAEAPARVPATAVDPEVEEYSLTAPKGARVAAGTLDATARRSATGHRVLSDAVPVEGYGAVGVTWARGAVVADDEIGLEVRYREGGAGAAWSDWMLLEYHDDHGPDPDSAEARSARPGTDALLVGEVDEVQVRVESDRAAPPDMRLAVIAPGRARATQREAPELDTSEMGAGGDVEQAPSGAEQGDLDLQAETVAPRPKIFSRAQWGADERLRDRPSLNYHEVHAGFVHHTVNANDYTRAQVPGIIRSIYAYHTRSLGWSDVGYNFLVDKFGRIWEGRYGGVARPVVGAHTLGYNDDSFAMSAIGNFETARPTDAMIAAYGRLFAWKLGLHGVGAGAKKRWVTSRYFKGINGHRDAGSTACPGQYLYARLPDIRAAAVQAQGSWAGRNLESDLVGTAHPDLVARRGSDGAVFLLPVQRSAAGRYSIGKAVSTGLNLASARNILKAGDWDADGTGDLIVRNADGTLVLHRGTGGGKFDAGRQIASGFAKVDLLAAAGDMTGDGYPDLVGQPRGGSYRIYPGAGLAGLRSSVVAYSNIRGAGRTIAAGRWDRDGAPDVFTRDAGRITLRPGNGPGGLTGTGISYDVRSYDWVVGVSDVGLNGHNDLIARERSTGTLYLVPGSVKGFGTRVSLGRSAAVYDYIA